MFVAWSPARSMDFATDNGWVQPVIWAGDSVM